MRSRRGRLMPLICRLSEITDHALSLMDLTPESLDLTPLVHVYKVDIIGLICDIPFLPINEPWALSLLSLDKLSRPRASLT
jgi:hypothetical protein